MTRIYLVRHAEAEGNLYRRAQGQWDGKITARGKLQIEALAERFRDVKIDVVYSSDLSRAVETAGAFTSGREVAHHKTPRLREVSMGEWEGEPWGELQYKYPEEMRNFNADFPNWSAPGSESFHDLQTRITEEMREIAARHDGETVAVVSHGMAIKSYLMGLLDAKPGTPEYLMHGDNTSVSLLEIENGAVALRYYNDNSHLGELSTFARQSWHKNGGGPDRTSFRYVPMNLRDGKEAELYLDCYRDTWIAAHGSDRGFAPAGYLSCARERSRRNPETVVKLFTGDEFAGIIELDEVRDAKHGSGWISLFYLRPEFRGRGLAIQMVGYAAAFFSKLGRSSLRLHVAVTNTRAVDFYLRSGFVEIGRDAGVVSEQYCMEKSI